MEVEAINEAGAAAGNLVVLRFDTSPLLKATFLIYVFPIICMIAGAWIGQEKGAAMGLDPSTASALVAFGALFVSLFIMRLIGNRLAHQDAYQPKIVRIKKTAP